VIPQDLQYSNDHEWIKSVADSDGGDGPVVRIGITDYAQNSLGDIVFVQLPDVGTDLAPGDSVGEVESTKSVSDIFAPVSGTVVARNDALDANPELVNSDPYGDGWMFELRLSDPGELSELLDAAAYAEVVGES
jgi:glycine cleavage system H protein